MLFYGLLQLSEAAGGRVKSRDPVEALKLFENGIRLRVSAACFVHALVFSEKIPLCGQDDGVGSGVFRRAWVCFIARPAIADLGLDCLQAFFR